MKTTFFTTCIRHLILLAYSALAMNCCSLALILIKKVSDKAWKVLKKPKRKSLATANKSDTANTKKSAAGSATASNQGQDDEEEEEPANKAKSTATEMEYESQSEIEESPAEKIANLREQVSSLLSFKEALCTEGCNLAIINAFKECWSKEQIESSDETKLGVARCFSYFRRVLSIAPHADWSSPSEILEQRVVHHRYIIGLRSFLPLLPGIISDINRAYHDDWLSDLLLIIFHITDGFTAEELFAVWKNDALLEDFNFNISENEDISSAGVQKKANDVQGASNKSLLMKQQVMQRAHNAASNSNNSNRNNGASNGHKPSGGGSFLNKILAERQQRLNQVHDTANRFSRHASSYTINLASFKPPSGNTESNAMNNANDGKDEEEDGKVKVIPSTAIFVKNPFQPHNFNENLPQAKAKRNKKKLTFNSEADYLEQSKETAKNGVEGQQACIIVASLVEVLTSDACLKSFVRRINEDLRRDELRISPEMEWQYFSIITKLLAFNRLKLEDQYRAFKAHSSTLPTTSDDLANAANVLEVGENGQESGKENEIIGKSMTWEPNLVNMIDTLDKMSFSRVTFALENLSKKPETHKLVVYPMALYTEVVSYLRILLESSNEGHHEIALGALYRLFFASTGHIDPLPKLLSAWKPHSYPRAHLTQLVEVVYQTLKTLDSARSLFINQGISSEEALRLSRKLKKKGKREMDMEQYLLACWRFSSDEYFRRLVNNHTVMMYARLLEKVAENSDLVNHRICTFLQKMMNYELEDDFTSPDPSSQQALQSSKKVNLGYMLYNLPTMIIIDKVLNDSQVMTNEHNQPLLRLLKSVIRGFGELSNHNHLLFVEVLFTHPRAHDHCLELQSVYDAHLMAKMSIANNFIDNDEDDDDEFDVRTGRDQALDDILNDRSTTTSKAAIKSTFNDDLGDEFDEADIPTFTSKKDKKRSLKNKNIKKNSLRVDSDNEIILSSSEDSTAGMKKMQRLATKASRKSWSTAEDDVLRTLYRRYAGTMSVYVTIAKSSEMAELGSTRNEKQIAHRVRQLKLSTIAMDDSDDASDEEFDEPETAPQVMITPKVSLLSAMAVEEGGKTSTETTVPVWERDLAAEGESDNNGNSRRLVSALDMMDVDEVDDDGADKQEVNNKEKKKKKLLKKRDRSGKHKKKRAAVDGDEDSADDQAFFAEDIETAPQLAATANDDDEYADEENATKKRALMAGMGVSKGAAAGAKSLRDILADSSDED